MRGIIATDRPTWRQSAGLAAAVSLLFVFAYAGSNGWSAMLSGVPSLHLPGEQQIPFLPWSVLPYWSLDLLFVGSFFLLADRAQLWRHSARLATAIVGAGLLFLLFPLSFAWTRPATDGIPDLLFAALSADQPFNQLPSLHVALALLIWPVVRRRTGGVMRSAAGLWFVLIALSTLTTWQHHLIDVFGGLLFGLLVGYALPLDHEPRDRVGARHRQLAARYALAAVGLLVPTLWGGAWLLLLWPAMSLALVASAYASGRRDFLKAGAAGLPACSWLLFGPWLLVMWLNVRLRRGRLGEAVELDSGLDPDLDPPLWLGPQPAICGMPAELQGRSDLTVVSLAPEVPQRVNAGLATVVIPALDLVVPGEEVTAEALAAIASALQRGPVYLHCALGYGRSAHVAAVWLQRRHSSAGMTLRQAQDWIRQRRPGALPELLSEGQSERLPTGPAHSIAGASR